MTSTPAPDREIAMEVASLIGEKYKMAVREHDGLYFLGPDSVVDVVFSESLSIPCTRAEALVLKSIDGYRVRAALVRRDGVYLKTIDSMMDGWLGIEDGVQVMSFDQDGYEEVAPIRRIAPARPQWFA